MNLPLLRPFLGFVLVLDSVPLKVEQLISWLPSGPQKVWLFPSGDSYSICKTTQEQASAAESVTLLS